MIVDTLKNLEKYVSLNPLFEKVVEYLKKRVAAFTIPKFFYDEGYIEAGEQYLQLRYIPAKVTRK